MNSESPSKLRNMALHGCVLQKKLKELLDSGVYSNKDKVTEGLSMLGIGILLIIFSLWLSYYGFIALVQFLLIPIIIYLFAKGAYMVITGKITKDIVFECPYCSQENKVLINIKARPCSHCLHIIHTRAGNKDACSFIAKCPYCDSRLLFYAGTGQFTCPNCESKLNINPIEESAKLYNPQFEQCSCGAYLPEDTFICRSCCYLIDPEYRIPKIDELFRCSLSPWGHLIWAQLYCKQIKNDISAQNGEILKDMDSIYELLHYIEETLLSLEVSVQDSSLSGHIGNVLTSLQEIYAFFLLSLYKFIKSNSVSFDNDSKILLPVQIQHKIYNSLKTIPPNLQLWQSSIIRYKARDVEGESGNKPEYVMVGYYKILEEAERLSSK